MPFFKWRTTYISLIIIIIMIFINPSHQNQNKETYHPLKIKIDYRYLTTKQKPIIFDKFNNAKQILENLIFSSIKAKIKEKIKIINICQQELYKKVVFNHSDIYLVPLFRTLENNIQISSVICNSQMKDKEPIISIIYLNGNINIYQNINHDENAKTIFFLKILRSFTNCLGLDVKFFKKIKFFNNYVTTPYYLLSSKTSYKSLMKLFKLKGKHIPRLNKYDNNAQFYSNKYWKKSSVVQDFRNLYIKPSSDMSEVSINLLNDLKFYYVNKCDFQYFHDKCYRIQQDCLTEDNMEKYYLNYGFKEKNKIFCYLSNSSNLKNKQCGTIFGHLINDNLDFCPFYTRNIGNIKEFPSVPELDYYKKQVLYLLVPSKKCASPSPRTIFFQSQFRSIGNNEVEKIILDKDHRDYFVTYLTRYLVYYPKFVEILEENGIIRSYHQDYLQNLYIKPIIDSNFLKRYKDKIHFSKYQKTFYFVGNTVYYLKNSLYKIYADMKRQFPEDYNFMAETYRYPEEADIISKKFGKYKLNHTDLWLVKPYDSTFGIGIHIFKSLKYEKKKHKYIITKYISHPHLIKGKKYDIRLYILVTGFKPLRIYLNKEGIIRFAVQKYEINDSSLDDIYMHLTNSQINQKSNKYVFPKDLNDENGDKWNLFTYKKYLKKKNINTELIFSKIKDLIIKIMIAGQEKMIKIASQYRISDISMFNLFGFDVIIDEQLNPLLLEINTKPSMHNSDVTDDVTKGNVFVDSLNIIGISPFSRKTKEPLDDYKVYNDHVIENVDHAICELTRPRGDFELIFPLRNNYKKYKPFFGDNNCPENELFWTKI